MSRVLVINDSALEGRIIADVLSSVGHQVETAGNAEACLKALEPFQPHLIILDIVLPGISGIELAKRILAKAEWRMTPLIFLSGTCCRATRIETLRVGGVDFIAKPFDHEELLARVDVALRHKFLLDWFKSKEENYKADAMVDFLTNLPNRQYLAIKMAEEIARAERYGHPFSVIMADVDKFKDINDQYGHITGDQVLAFVANILRNQIRQSDMVFRYGGEEFCILAPETDLDGGVILAKKLCSNFGSQHIAIKAYDENREIQTTISFGVAEFRHGRDLAESLLGRADQALYIAKRSGRNRVECVS